MKRALASLICAGLLSAAPAEAVPLPFVTTSVQAGDVISNTSTATAFATKWEMGATGTSPAMTTGTDPSYGKSVKVDLYGVYSTQATPGTFTFQLEAFNGGTLYSLGSTGAVTPPASQTNAAWRYSGICVFNKTGGSGIASCQGALDFYNATTGAWQPAPMVVSGTGTTNWTTGVVTNANALTGIEAVLTMQTASASNSMTLSMASFLPLN